MYHLTSSAGKESTSNTGDPGSIPGSGKSAREGIGYPLQYSWASLAAQLVKSLPAMWEAWVWTLGWEDPLEKGMATHSSILASRIPWSVYSPCGHKESDTTKRFSLSLYFLLSLLALTAKLNREKANKALPREHTGHSKHPLSTKQEKNLHMDITRWSTLKLHYILCSQRWRNSIESAETRLGADCGSDHELPIAKFRLK